MKIKLFISIAIIFTTPYLQCMEQPDNDTEIDTDVSLHNIIISKLKQQPSESDEIGADEITAEELGLKFVDYSKEASLRLINPMTKLPFNIKFAAMEKALQDNADPNFLHLDIFSPLYLANSAAEIKLLIAHKADVNQRVMGESVLYWHVYYNSIDTIKILLLNGSILDNKTLERANHELPHQKRLRKKIKLILRQHLIEQAMFSRPNYAAVISDLIAEYAEDIETGRPLY